jgi:CheY-like chemotaxis protein
MTDRHCVALQGFSAFERNALASCFRLSHGQATFDPVDGLAQAEFVVADADHPGVIDAVLAAGRLEDTVFIGAHPPEGAQSWMMRPIDPLQVLRELDAMVALRHPRPAAAPSRRAAPRPVPGRRAGDAPAELLIVDDSEVALRLLERELHRLGLKTRRALTSVQALELMAAHRFDAVILDVELGDESPLDGFALCQQIKREHLERATRAPPVVILSAHGEAVNQVRGTFAGCDGYLAKPLDTVALARMLRRLGVPVADQ